MEGQNLVTLEKVVKDTLMNMGSIMTTFTNYEKIETETYHSMFSVQTSIQSREDFIQVHRVQQSRNQKPTSTYRRRYFWKSGK